MGLKCCFYFPKVKDESEIANLIRSYNYELILWTKKSENALINEILKQQPDLLFLDIDTCNIESLYHAMIQYLEKTPVLVSISKNTKQAFKCIKFGVKDYLLKPLHEFELRKTLVKLKKDLRPENSSICFKNYSDYYFLNSEDILYLKADNNTTDIIMVNGKTLPAFKTLKIFEQNLPKNFLRIHNSYIINTHKVLRINFGKSQVYLDHKSKSLGVPFSKSYRAKLKYLRELLAEKDILF